MNIKKQCDQEMVHPKYLNGFKPGFCRVSDTQSKVLEVAWVFPLILYNISHSYFTIFRQSSNKVSFLFLVTQAVCGTSEISKQLIDIQNKIWTRKLIKNLLLRKSKAGQY